MDKKTRRCVLFHPVFSFLEMYPKDIIKNTHRGIRWGTWPKHPSVGLGGSIIEHFAIKGYVVSKVNKDHGCPSWSRSQSHIGDAREESMKRKGVGEPG